MSLSFENFFANSFLVAPTTQPESKSISFDWSSRLLESTYDNDLVFASPSSSSLSPSPSDSDESIEFEEDMRQILRSALIAANDDDDSMSDEGPSFPRTSYIPVTKGSHPQDEDGNSVTEYQAVEHKGQKKTVKKATTPKHNKKTVSPKKIKVARKLTRNFRDLPPIPEDKLETWIFRQGSTKRGSVLLGDAKLLSELVHLPVKAFNKKVKELKLTMREIENLCISRRRLKNAEAARVRRDKVESQLKLTETYKAENERLKIEVEVFRFENNQLKIKLQNLEKKTAKK